MRKTTPTARRLLPVVTIITTTLLLTACGSPDATPSPTYTPKTSVGTDIPRVKLTPNTNITPMPTTPVP